MSSQNRTLSLQARQLAFEALRRVVQKKATLPKSLEKAGSGKASPQSMGIAWDISYTAMRHLGPILAVLEKHERPQVLAGRGYGLGLWLGLSETLLQGTPAFAAVDLWVEVLKKAGLGKDGGAVNARLRRLLETPPELDLSMVYPSHLAGKIEHLGKERAERFLAATHQAPPSLMVDLGKSPGDWTKEGYSPSGWPAICQPTDEALDSSAPKTQVRRESGDLLVVDAQSVALALSLPVGESLLDLCAGSGIKSRLIRERPKKPHRHVMVTTEKLVSLNHWRYCNDRSKVAALQKPPTTERFEAVWVDSPCTGSGTLARNPEIQLRLSDARVDKQVTTQMDLLLKASLMVKPGGDLVYLTCSVFQEENEFLIAEFRKLNPAFRSRKAEKLDMGFPVDIVPVPGGAYVLPPSGAGDHFFVAVLKREKP